MGRTSLDEFEKPQATMNVFRLHIRPGGGLADSEFSFAYCLEAQVLGIGWQTYSDKVISIWEEYEAEASQHHPDLSRVLYLKNHLKKDDLIWTRSPSGHYYLAKAASEWEYFTNDRAKDADIVNVVRCEILKVPSIDSVPGKVVACFRPTRTIQKIADEHIRQYSQSLWNKLSGTSYYSSAENVGGNVFPFLGSDATEDVIFIYLQTKGWLVVPNSRKADTMSFEFYLINRETRERAIVQIKTGNTSLNISEWKARVERVFLFQSSGLYFGNSHPSVVCIPPAEITAFMDENRDLLPASTVYWMNHVGLGKAPATVVTQSVC
jgi:hypothetical protein